MKESNHFGLLLLLVGGFVLYKVSPGVLGATSSWAK